MSTSDDSTVPASGAPRSEPSDEPRAARVLVAGEITGRGNSVNAFVVVDDAPGFITFVETVFGGREVEEVRTATPTGRLIHAEVRVGDALVLLADTQPGWTARPGLFQVWVADVAAVLEVAGRHGARVVTPATPFYGELTLARLEDPWHNLWWMFQPTPGQADPTPAWEGGSDTVFATIDEYMRASPPR